MASIEKRVSTEGEITYRVKIRLKGYPVQTATFSRLTDAKRWSQQTEAAIREGRHFKTTEAKRHTLAELIDRYKRDVLPNKSDKTSNLSAQKQQLEWWKGQLGAYTLSEITPARIGEMRDLLASGVTVRNTQRSPATVNRYMAILSHAFTVAVNEWGWIDDSPMRKVRKMREPKGRIRFLSDDERKRLLSECQKNTKSPYLYPVVVLALSTGARYGEIITLKWNDVDLSRGLMVLHETKNNERRVLPLAGLALEIMKAHAKIRRIDTSYVFPNIKGDQPSHIRTAFENALIRSEIHDFTFHGLRHSAASYLAMNGASLAEIAEVLGHKTLQMVKRYAHLSEAHTSAVVARMNERIFANGVG